jgi:hypothetical protein
MRQRIARRGYTDIETFDTWKINSQQAILFLLKFNKQSNLKNNNQKKRPVPSVLKIVM